MADLSRLLRPRSIAYIGGRHLEAAIRTCRRTGYDGALHIVNPMRDEIGGIPCVADLSALPAPPDAALVALSPERSIEAVRALAQAGAGGAVVMTSGFREIGDDGAALQDALVEAAGDMPLLGPNCLGVMNMFDGGAVWGDDVAAAPVHGKGAAIISQSGAFLIGVTCIEQAFPLGYAISVGNQAKDGMAGCIDAVLDDPRVGAIGLYLEGINDGAALGRVCARAGRQGVPIVALKGGDGDLGAEVAQSHTAALLVEREIWEAFARRFGIVEVSSLKALVEALKVLTIGGVPGGNRLTFVSFSGGLSGQAARLAGPLGLDLPPPAPDRMRALRDRMPPTVPITNPMDMNLPYTSNGGISIADTDAMADAIVDLADGVADQIAFFLDVPRAGPDNLDKPWTPALDAMKKVRGRTGLPCIVSGILPEGLEPSVRARLLADGLVPLCSFTDGMEAIGVAARFATQGMPSCAPLLAATDGTDAPVLLDETKSKDMLAAYGIISPPRIVCDAAGAAYAAQGLVGPVAVKVLSDQIMHKAAVGGVVLNLADGPAVAKAVAAMTSKGLPTTRVLIEQMIARPAAEIILGVKHVPAMGLAMVIGRGGAGVEDGPGVDTLLLPLVEAELDAALTRLDLDDVVALRAAALAFATFATDHATRLHAAEINPLIITEDGAAFAADAVIQMAPDGETP